jgi:hypothetical protein
MASVAAIRVVALWLSDGPLVVGGDPLDGAACVDLEAILRSLRLARRWDLFASTKMLVGIQNARVAFTRSAFHLTRTIQAEEISDLRSQIVAATFREARLSTRVDALEEEILIREEVTDDLRLELAALTEEAAVARRADRPEPEPELEPDELMM